MAKYIVDRSKWYRGQTSMGSYLLRADGKKCCIGFVGEQCGIPAERLLNTVTINMDRRSQQAGIPGDELPEPSKWDPQWPRWMQSRAERVGSDIDRAYATNDSPFMTQDAREAKLKEIFARNGDEIEFVDGEPDNG